PFHPRRRGCSLRGSPPSQERLGAQKTAHRARGGSPLLGPGSPAPGHSRGGPQLASGRSSLPHSRLREAALTEAEFPPPSGLGEEPLPESGPPITSRSERASLLYSALLLRLRPLWPWLVVVVVAWLGWREVQRVDLLEVRRILKATPASLTLTMLLFTGL